MKTVMYTVSKKEEEAISIGTITLRWSDWFLWNEVKVDARYGG
jgi:hypothetical protein